MYIKNDVIIKYKDMTICTHNTMTELGLKAMGELRKYGEYLLVGTSRHLQVQNVSDLATYHSGYNTRITDYNYDVASGHLFVTRTAEVVSAEDFVLTEMGLSYGGLQDGIINYITIKDENNMPDAIEVEANTPINISVKTSLNIGENSDIFFTKGENILVQSILGVRTADKNKMFLVRGGNIIGNDTAVDHSLIDKNYPEKIPAVFSAVTALSNGVYKTQLTFESGAINLASVGNVYELVLVLDGADVARYEYLHTREKSVEANYTCAASGILDFDFHINSIELLKDVTSDTIIADMPNMIQTAYNFGYGVEKAFDENIGVQTGRYLSSDSKIIGFVVDNQLLLYKDENFRLRKINTASFVSRTDIDKVVITADYVFVIYNSNGGLHLDCYLLTDDAITAKVVDDTGLNNVIGDDVVSKMDVCYDGTYFRIGVICGENNHGYILKYSVNQEGNVVYSSCSDSYLTNCTNLFAFSKHAENTNSQVVFMTNNYNNQGLYKIVNMCGDLLKSSTVQTLGAAIMDNVVRYAKTNSTIIAIKQDGSSVCMFPENFVRFNTVNESVENITFDNQMRNAFCITKSGQVKIMHSANLSNFTSIVNGFPSGLIPIENVQDMVFMNDCVLVFANMTTAKAYIIQLPRIATSICGLTPGHEYHIEYKMANNPGANGDYLKMKAKFVLDIVEV